MIDTFSKIKILEKELNAKPLDLKECISNTSSDTKLPIDKCVDILFNIYVDEKDLVDQCIIQSVDVFKN
jgi:hypothetical protein